MSERASSVVQSVARVVAALLVGAALLVMFLPASADANGSCGNLVSGRSDGWCGTKEIGWWIVAFLLLLAAGVIGADRRRRRLRESTPGSN